MDIDTGFSGPFIYRIPNINNAFSFTQLDLNCYDMQGYIFDLFQYSNMSEQESHNPLSHFAVPI